MAHRVPLKHKELLCVSKRQELDHADGWAITLRVYASDGWQRTKTTYYYPPRRANATHTRGWKRVKRWIPTPNVKHQSANAPILNGIRDNYRDAGWTVHEPGANRCK